MSLQSGTVPSSMKHSIVVPLLKKYSLPKEALARYRPISHLSFIAKLTERAAAAQVKEYLGTHDLLPKVQSAYRKHHSVELALVKVQNDILLANDRQEEVVLLLLDFSAAYDTVEHSIMLKRLASRYGFSDTVLKWFSSYLFNRTHSVKVQDALSALHNKTCGIPQGSVMGPLLYTLYSTYSAPLYDGITAHGLHAMMYTLTTPS